MADSKGFDLNRLLSQHTFILFLIAICFSQSFAQVDAEYVLGLRANKDQALQYSQTSGLAILNSDTREFDNGNTFVRFKDSVIGKKVTLLLPKIMSSDDLMEALIKVRTAYTNGASEISILFTATVEETKLITKKSKNLNMDWLNLFSIAGADSVIINGRQQHVNKPAARRRQFSRDQSYVAGNSHPELTNSLARELNLPVLSSIDDLSKGSQVFFVSASSQEVNDNIFESMDKIQNFKQKGTTVHLILSNLPYARSDKVDQQGVTVIGRLVTDILEFSGVDAITFVRAHAPQSQGFFEKPQFQISGRKTINDFLKTRGVHMVIAPDFGAHKDDTFYAQVLGLNLGVINKVRDPLTSKIKIAGFSSAEDVREKVIVIIDDETSSGETLALAAEYLKSQGAVRVIALVTHLTGSAQKALESPHIDEMVVTDTLPISVRHKKLTVISIAKELSQGLNPWILRTPQRCGSVFSSFAQ